MSADTQVALVRSLLDEGAALHRERRIAEAEQRYQAALKIDPSHFDARRLLALILAETKRTGGAVAIYRQLLDSRPRDSKILCEIGSALQKCSFFEDARDALERAVAIDPTNIQARFALGEVLDQLSFTDEAVEEFETILLRHPDHLASLNELARLYVFRGQFTLAQETINRALDVDPSNPIAYSVLARTRKFSAGDPVISRMESVAARKDVTSLERRSVLQGLGKVYDDIGDYDSAIRCFQMGHAERDATYDHRTTVEKWTKLKYVFSGDFFAARRNFGNASPRPIFIVGMPRSGTSLVEQILAAHPHVHGGGEAGLSVRAIRLTPNYSNAKSEYPDICKSVTREGASTLAGKLLRAMDFGSEGAQRITDKFPHNFEALGLTALLLPGAKIIHCKRDPLDTCLSIHMRFITSPYPWSGRLSWLGQYYREYERLMHHWEQALPIQIHQVIYEDLVSDPEAGARKLVAYSGLDWDPACLDFHTSGRVVRTPSSWQVRQAIYDSSIGRSRHYERHLGPLISALNGQPMPGDP